MKHFVVKIKKNEDKSAYNLVYVALTGSHIVFPVEHISDKEAVSYVKTALKWIIDEEFDKLIEETKT